MAHSLTTPMQADKIEKLEKDHGWNEEQFDFILQFLRTILLKREIAQCHARLCHPLILTQCRRRLTHLYYTFPCQLPPIFDPFFFGDTLSLETTIIKAQCDRPRQDSRPCQLGFLGQDSDY